MLNCVVEREIEEILLTLQLRKTWAKVDQGLE